MKPEKALVVIAALDSSLDSVVREMGARSRDLVRVGIAVIIDGDGIVQGVLTDGDIRRAYAQDFDFGRAVNEVMTSDPVTIPPGLPSEEIIGLVRDRLRDEGLPHRVIRHVLVLDEEGKLVDVYDFLELLTEHDPQHTEVAVIGMGFVGLTLAVALATRRHYVTGVETRRDVVDALNAGITHVLEPGLIDMLRVQLDRKAIRFASPDDVRNHRVYIIAVGTPIDAEGKPDLSALRTAVEWIGKRLRRRDMVMLRSTVPVGTTREYVVPILEEASSLKAGTDFSLAFTPERTVQGDAMRELKNIPQIVGGLTPRCTQRTMSFWSTLAPSVAPAESLEAAELTKLANNSFRDLSFAFSNELSLLADKYNINAFRLIETANKGYGRNPIPKPSPGVGGYCLSKDPLLYSWTMKDSDQTISLSQLGREVNARASLYPILTLERFARHQGRPLSSLVILIVGFAFKGEPETNDVRGSVALDVARQLQHQDVTVKAWDAVIPPETIKAHGVEPVTDLVTAIDDVDAVLILNNHRAHIKPGLFIKSSGKLPKLIFDGWYQLDPDEIQEVPGLVYATMGYLSDKT